MSAEARAGISDELEAADKRGIVVRPDDMIDAWQAEPLAPGFAFEDIPGNEYPRKATLFLNYNGGMILNSNSENSSENESNIGKDGEYPVFLGGETRAIAIAQAVAADLAPFGMRVVYMERPPKMLPYTMQMMGGDACDDVQLTGGTSCGAIAGVASPGYDCGSLNQRHIVYTFGEGGSTVQTANTASQEAGHAWGLDHVLDCNSVMSYCAQGDGSFTDGCAGFCTSCQPDAPIGCIPTHERFCGEGSGQQDDVAEMNWQFGGNEPDMEPPVVEIVEPEDGLELDAGGDVDLRAIVSDNYGGMGWQFVITKDDEVIFEQVDYEKDVDPEYRAALNLTNLEAGVYTLTVEGMDHTDTIVSDSVTIYVGGATTGTSDSDSDSGTSGDGDSDSDDSDSGDSDDSDDGSDTDVDTAGGDGGGDKGGCSIGDRSQGAPVGLVLLMLGAAVRGSRRRTR